MLKLIKLHTFKVCSLLYFKYTSTKLYEKKVLIL